MKNNLDLENFSHRKIKVGKFAETRSPFGISGLGAFFVDHFARKRKSREIVRNAPNQKISALRALFVDRLTIFANPLENAKNL